MMSIASINVNGLNDPLKTDAIFLNLNEAKHDIVLLQETHLNPVTADTIISKDRWDGPKFHSFGNDNRKGVSILLSNKLNTMIHSSYACNNGHYLILDLSIDNNRVLLINVYAPTGNPNGTKRRVQTFIELFRKIAAYPDDIEHVICGGDFNCVLNNYLDRSQPTNFVDRSSKLLADNIHKFELEDIWRTLHPKDKQFTHRSTVNTFGRIDKFYTSRNSRVTFTSCSIEPFPHSDHDKVILNLNFNGIKLGPGVWHLNTSALKEKEYVDLINEFWDKWRVRKEDFGSLSDWWEEGKLNISKISKKYLATRAKETRQKKSQLYKQLRNLNRKTQLTEEIRFINLSKKVSDEIKHIETQQAEGIKLRAKARWTEEGEKVTKYFCSLEKKKQGDRLMRSIKDKHSKIVQDPVGICETVRQFYQELYTQEPVDTQIQNELFDNLSSTLTEEQRKICEGPLTEKELKTAVSQMVNSRSPGLDGLPCEFYKMFWGKLGRDLFEVVDKCFEDKSLTLSQKIGLITCLFKKGDRLDLQNWRPISLLNVDYKIIAKALANRLAKVLHLIISEDQTCAVPGRTILSTCHSLRDIIQICEDENLPLALLSIDQMKAFDRVSWDFLFKTLAKFNFGPTFIGWVKILYNDTQSAVKVNGHVSNTFNLGRGVRQGCPLSALLYVLVAEVFAATIRNDKSISGLKLNNEEFKILQYAIDTTLLLHGNNSLDNCIKQIKKFEKAAGAKLNAGKSEGIWLGSYKNRTDSPHGFNWNKKSLKILGLYFGTENTKTLNWKDRITKFTKILNIWQSRELSFRGKAIVLQQLASSVLWYPATVFPLPDWAVKQLNEALWKFVYNGKKDTISRLQAKLSYEKGGLNIIDIEKKSHSLRLSWLAKLVNPEIKGKWKTLFNHFLNQYKHLGIGANVLKCHLTLPGLCQLPEFYKVTLKSFLSLCDNKRTLPEPENEIFNEPLFQNSLIAKEKVLLEKTWADAGISLVRDITYESAPGFLPSIAL